MHDETIALPDPNAEAGANAAPSAGAASAPDAATLQAAEWERMVRIRGARHAGLSAKPGTDERPR